MNKSILFLVLFASLAYPINMTGAVYSVGSSSSSIQTGNGTGSVYSATFLGSYTPRYQEAIGVVYSGHIGFFSLPSGNLTSGVSVSASGGGGGPLAILAPGIKPFLSIPVDIILEPFVFIFSIFALLVLKRDEVKSHLEGTNR